MLTKAIGLPLVEEPPIAELLLALTRREELRFIPTERKYFLCRWAAEIPVARCGRDINNGDADDTFSPRLSY
jgi:hypothetical protein